MKQPGLTEKTYETKEHEALAFINKKVKLIQILFNVTLAKAIR